MNEFIKAVFVYHGLNCLIGFIIVVAVFILVVWLNGKN